LKKIYFACAVTAGRDHAHRYPVIVQFIKDAGMHVLSELFADTSVEASKGIGMKKGMAPAEIWRWDMDWIEEADAIIAEITQPSLGVGYEIGAANALGKPVLALYHPQPDRKPSSMIVGSPNVTLFEYDDISGVGPVIKTFLAQI
jgi:nucleoside 2-deoxyribosyltransferase